MSDKQPNKALQAIPIQIGTVLCGWEAVGRHNAVVVGASASPVAVPEPGRRAEIAHQTNP